MWSQFFSSYQKKVSESHFYISHIEPTLVFFFNNPGKEIQEIIDDRYAEVGSNSSAFWVMVAALKVSNWKIVESVCWDFSLLD